MVHSFPTNSWASHSGYAKNDARNQNQPNIFTEILEKGTDKDFLPTVTDQFASTNAPAGSDEKIEVLRQRVQLGLPLWHQDDRRAYEGLTGAINPRN